MEYVVLQEAGQRFAPLDEQLRTILTETASVVETVTGLKLPERVVLRTTTARQWMKEHKIRDKRRMKLEKQELGPRIPTQDQRTAKAKMRGGRMSKRLMWVGIGAQTVEIEPGFPEVQILPEALTHGGVIGELDFLYKLVGHELTHLAQYHTSRGAMWKAANTFYPGLRGIADRDPIFVTEGHAYWADQQITTKILGYPVSTSKIHPLASARYKAVESARSPEMRAYFRRAVDTATEIIDTKGVETFNQVWTNSDLVPTEAETDSPELWCQRFN